MIHRAPLDTACADEAGPVAGEGACAFDSADEPEGWDAPGFDASVWPAATVHTAAEVDPKMGYDEIDWAGEVELIWGPSLTQDNTILCRITVE